MYVSVCVSLNVTLHVRLALQHLHAFAPFVCVVHVWPKSVLEYVWLPQRNLSTKIKALSNETVSCGWCGVAFDYIRTTQSMNT